LTATLNDKTKTNCSKAHNSFWSFQSIDPVKY